MKQEVISSRKGLEGIKFLWPYYYFYYFLIYLPSIPLLLPSFSSHGAVHLHLKFPFPLTLMPAY